MSLNLQRVTLKDAQTLLEIEKTTKGLKTYFGYFTEEEIKNYINNDIVYFI